MLTINEKNYPILAKYLKNPSVVYKDVGFNKMLARILDELANNFPHIEVSFEATRALVQYLFYRYEQSLSTQKKFKGNHVLYTAILLSLELDNKKLADILRKEKYSLLDLAGMERLCKITNFSFMQVSVILSNYLQYICKHETAMLTQYISQLKLLLTNLSRSLALPKNINKNKEAILFILLNLPQDFLAELDIETKQQILHVAIAYIEKPLDLKALDGLAIIFAEFSGSQQSLLLATLLEKISSSTDLNVKIFKDIVARLVEVVPSHHDFINHDILEKIYDLNLGFKDYKWLNLQIERYLATNKSQKGVFKANSGVFVTPELFNMISGDEKYSALVKIIACYSNDWLYKQPIDIAVKSICNLATILTLKVMAGKNTNIAPTKESLSNYLQDLLSECGNHKLKIMAIMENPHAEIGGFLITKQIETSLVRLDNGNHICYEPNLKNGGIVFTSDNLSVVIDYIMSQLHKDMKNQTIDKLHAISIVKYTVGLVKKDNLLTSKSPLLFDRALRRVQSEGDELYRSAEINTAAIIRSSSTTPHL